MNGEMLFNTSYVSPEVIWAELTGKYRKKRIDLSLVTNWCARVEREFIKDVTCMIHYMKQPLEVVDGNAFLPVSLFRLLAVYDQDDKTYRYSTNGSYLFNLRHYDGDVIDEDEDSVYIDYVGMVLDERCIPMIPEWHSQACEVFCKLQMFEEDYAMGQFNTRLYETWQQQIPGLIQSARGSNYRQFTKEALNNLRIIQGNMFPRLEQTSLRDEQVYPEQIEE